VTAGPVDVARGQREVRRRAIVGGDHEVPHPDQLDPEHRTRGRVVGDQLLDDAGEHAGLGDRDRRPGHHHAAGQQAREHPLDAAGHAAQDAIVDVIEREADELRDQQAGIRAAHLDRATRS